MEQPTTEPQQSLPTKKCKKKNWVKSEAKFLGVDLNTPQGHEFYQREARLAAERLVK